MEGEESPSALADFLAASINMEKFTFYNHSGREIEFEVKVPSEDAEEGAADNNIEEASVTVTVKGTDEVEERETARTIKLDEPDNDEAKKTKDKMYRYGSKPS